MASTALPGAARRARRARIESAALHLFRERGFDAVTVEEVCAEAGVAPATFYRYFGSKEEVVFTYRETFAAALAEALEEAETELPPRQLARTLTAFATALEPMREEIGLRDSIVRGHPGLMRRTLAVQRDTEVLLAEGLGRIRGGEDPDTDLLEAALGVLVLRMGMRSWLGGEVASFRAGVRQALTSARSLAGRLEV
jgi:AcrR family transcriptional regulator